ncbi:hypothetical protein LRP30_32345 [Bradyrhizobium sp. C-145]|uniref:hypothetical protein n=1 Tax=Bradyrhizobium sp. C-145 TaxID=574727 RepID=UPI00201B876D|nr:hypothetical protein [Bradyrhizobium sp. C-145]UQR61362.1 hypothetical protein LRP30_31115 [Bradyrhizobium sp. C-145]UQR61512.1 hypothetical protein LRP30_32345 [Bradyrhizobium sp. C-145]
MTDYLDLFAPTAGIAMPTFSVGTIKHAQNARRTGHSRPHMLDAPFDAIDGGILCCQHQRQSATSPARGLSIGPAAPTGA